MFCIDLSNNGKAGSRDPYSETPQDYREFKGLTEIMWAGEAVVGPASPSRQRFCLPSSHRPEPLQFPGVFCAESRPALTYYSGL